MISIIMNSHNGEKFIERSIRSILNQTYKNWELIFWDNKSNDNSLKIINQFNDDRIKYFYSKNYDKLYKARNLALKKAKGEFIAFLDVDDTWEKNKLQVQSDDIIKNKADISFSNYWELKKNKKKIFKKSLTAKNINNQILNNYPIGILTVLIKSDVFFKKNFFFDESYEIIGDFDFFFRLSTKVKFSCVNLPLATYFIHSNNLSIKKLDLEIEEFNNWILNNNQILINNKNKIFENQNIRICNYLFNDKKLFVNSSELKKISNIKIRFKFYLKLILQRLNIL